MKGRSTFAIQLEKAKSEILETWEKSVREVIPAASTESRSALRDSLPEFLDDLVLALDTNLNSVKSEIVKFAHKHGAERANASDYSIEDALTEYNILRRIIFSLLEKNGPLPSLERDVIYEAINLGLAKAGAEYTKQQIKELKNSRSQLYDFFMQCPAPLVIIECPELRFSLANPPYEKLVGRKVIGKTFSEVFTEEAALETAKIILEVYRTGEPYFLKELEISLPDDLKGIQEYFLNVSYTPIRGNDGKINSVTALVFDVTEEVEARKIIEKSEEHFRILANALPQIIWTADSNFYVDWYNDWWYEYLDLPRGTKWDDPGTSPMHPDDVELTKPRLVEAVRTGNNFNMEQRFRRGSDDQYRWHLVRGVPIKDSHGKIIKWVGANTDIHDQKMSAETLKHVQERFDIATLSTRVGVWDYDIKEDEAWRNLSHDLLHGYKNKLEKWNLDIALKHVYPEDREKFETTLNDAFINGKEWFLEYRVVWPNKSIHWIQARAHVLKDQHGKPLRLIGTSIDISEHKNITESLEEEKTLREKFVSTLSHDLRTPLTAAKISAQIIGRTAEDEKLKTLSHRINDNLGRADKMIQDLLDASTVRAGGHLLPNKQEVDVVDVVHRTTENLSTIHGDRFRLSVPDKLQAFLSPDSLTRIVENLCNNAIKYGSSRDPIEVVVNQVESNLFICVKNKGNPLIKIDKDKLFEPFQRGTSAELVGKSGWGIGLTIVKGLTEAHGGEVSVESNDEGTLFRIQLPLDARSKSPTKLGINH